MDDVGHLGHVDGVKVGGGLAPHFRVAAAPAGGHHLPAGHMLQNGQAKAFVEAGLHGQAGGGDDRGQVFVGNPAQGFDHVAQAIGGDLGEEGVVEPAFAAGQEQM